MRKAGKWSGRAYTKAMAQEFETEKELWSFLDYEFKRGGCDGSAYVPVVAGGKVRGGGAGERETVCADGKVRMH